MIEYKIGDIFDGNEDIICHQVNTYGIMGAGIAKQIKDRFPEVFKTYEMKCADFQRHDIIPLGGVLYCNQYLKPIIANLFSQNHFTTDYKALEHCLSKVLTDALKNNLSVAIPYKIGCGIASGDWNKVEEIIRNIFEDSDVKCVIYKLEGID